MAHVDGDVYYARHDAPDGKGRGLTREDELFFGGAVWAAMSQDAGLARVVLGHAAVRELFGFDTYLAMKPSVAPTDVLRLIEAPGDQPVDG
jgi:hypothetical protein